MGDLGSTSLFYASRPTIKIDGREETALSEGLLSMLVEETGAGLFRCEISLGNWGPENGETGFLYFDRQLLDFGKTLTIYAGDEEAEAQIFEGRIMGLEANYPKSTPPEILVLAEDCFQDLRMTRRSRTFEEATDEDIIRQLASEHGLKTDIDVDGPTYRVLAQINQSDLAFLRERARSIDAELWVEGSKLYACSRGRRDSTEVTLTYGRGLHELSVMADLAGQCSSLVIGGWDVAAKESIAYEVGESAIKSELNGSQAGGSILQQALGARTQRIVHKVPLSTQEARFQAEAAYRRLARRFITGRGVAEGDGRIRVGTGLKLQGLGEMFDGEYYVTEARHTFDLRSGLRSHFEVERPGL
jgi:phage protein D